MKHSASVPGGKCHGEERSCKSPTKEKKGQDKHSDEHPLKLMFRSWTAAEAEAKAMNATMNFVATACRRDSERSHSLTPTVDGTLLNPFEQIHASLVRMAFMHQSMLSQGTPSLTTSFKRTPQRQNPEGRRPDFPLAVDLHAEDVGKSLVGQCCGSFVRFFRRTWDFCPDHVLLTGFVLKQSRYLKCWRRRVAGLTLSSLSTFQQDQHAHPTECFQLLDVTSVNLVWNRVVLQIKTRECILQFDELYEAARWAHTIINKARASRIEMAEVAVSTSSLLGTSMQPWPAAAD